MLGRYVKLNQDIPHYFQIYLSLMDYIYSELGVEGAVRGLEGTHPADSCILTKLE
jgi:hypothetical protein